MGNSPSHPPPPHSRQSQGTPPRAPRTQTRPQPQSQSPPQHPNPYPYGHQQHPTPSPTHQHTSPPPPSNNNPWQPYYNYSAPHYYQYPPGTYPPGYQDPAAYQYPPPGYPNPGAPQYPYPPGYPNPSGYWHPGMPPTAAPGASRVPGASIEHVKEIQTVRNPVNVKRSSVRLEPDETNPSRHVLCFTFDATVAGKLAVFWVAQEGPGCSFRPLHPDLHPSPVLPFERGLNQKFRQPGTAAVDLSLFPQEQLQAVEAGDEVEVFPLVICMVSHRAPGEGEKSRRLEGDAAAGASSGMNSEMNSGMNSGPVSLGLLGPSGTGSQKEEEAGSGSVDLLGLGGEPGSIEPGQPLDSSVQAQMTYAVLQRHPPGSAARKASLASGAAGAAADSTPSASPSKPGSSAPAGALQQGAAAEYDVKVVKQRIWVDGAEYDLQEIYGMEHCAGAGGDRDNRTSEGTGPGGSGQELARDASTSSDDIGTECVICLAAPRNTTVLPCRHMCMCGECAEVLRFQSNKCPICRHTVEGLLQIKLKSKSPSDLGKTWSEASDAPRTSTAASPPLAPVSQPPPPPPLDDISSSLVGTGSAGAPNTVPPSHPQSCDSFVMRS